MIKDITLQALIIFLANLIEWVNKKLIQVKNRELMNKLEFWGEEVIFKGKIQVNNPEKIVINDKVYIGSNVLLAGKGGIVIGENTSIGLNVVILSATHDYHSSRLPYAPDVYILKPTFIGRNVWVGANVAIAPGSKIGDGAIVACGTVVSGNVEPLAIVGNQKIRVLGYRNKEHYEKLVQDVKPDEKRAISRELDVVKRSGD